METQTQQLTAKEKRKLYMKAYAKIYYNEQEEANTDYYKKSIEAGRARYKKLKEAFDKTKTSEGSEDTPVKPVKVFKKRNIVIQ